MSDNNSHSYYNTLLIENNLDNNQYNNGYLKKRKKK